MPGLERQLLTVKHLAGYLSCVQFRIKWREGRASFWSSFSSNFPLFIPFPFLCDQKEEEGCKKKEGKGDRKWGLAFWKFWPRVSSSLLLLSLLIQRNLTNTLSANTHLKAREYIKIRKRRQWHESSKGNKNDEERRKEKNLKQVKGNWIYNSDKCLLRQNYFPSSFSSSFSPSLFTHILFLLSNASCISREQERDKTTQIQEDLFHSLDVCCCCWFSSFPFMWEMFWSSRVSRWTSFHVLQTTLTISYRTFLSKSS